MILGLVNNAFSSAQIMQCQMAGWFCEWWIWNDSEGGSCALFQSNFPAYAWRAKENCKTTQSL